MSDGLSTGHTAAMLRELGQLIPDDVPDCAMLHGSGLEIVDSTMAPDGRFTCSIRVKQPYFEWWSVTAEVKE